MSKIIQEERKKEKIFKIYTYSNLKQFELDSTTTGMQKKKAIYCVQVSEADELKKKLDCRMVICKNEYM